MQRLVVTIDGTAGSGKSTVAQLLAKRLDAKYLDTGAMYRAFAVRCMDARVNAKTHPSEAVELAQRTQLAFHWDTVPPRLLIDGHDPGQRIRDPDVTAIVSDVASVPGVRQVMVAHQREIGRRHPRLVAEGRDQGSVVFPDAQAKFYLDASPQVRAKRRAQQYSDSGQRPQEHQVLDAILDRDQRDRQRQHSPLPLPPGRDLRRYL